MIWDSEEELREAISDNQRIIDSNDDKVEELCKEKGRLECARNIVYNHYLTYLDEIYYKDVFEEYHFGDKWKGETFDEFDRAIDEIIKNSVYALKNDLEACYLQMDEYKEKTLPGTGREFCEIYHLRLRAASAFFLRLTLGFS